MRRRGMLLVEALFGLLVLVLLGLVAYSYLYQGFSDGVDLSRRGHADVLARDLLDRFADLPLGDIEEVLARSQRNRDENGRPRLDDATLNQAEVAIDALPVYEQSIGFDELPGDRAAGVLTAKVSWRPPAGVRQTIVYRRYLFPPEGFEDSVREASGFTPEAEAAHWGHATSCNAPHGDGVAEGPAAELPEPYRREASSPGDLIARAATTGGFAPVARRSAAAGADEAARAAAAGAGGAPGRRTGFDAAADAASARDAMDGPPASRLGAALPLGQDGARRTGGGSRGGPAHSFGDGPAALRFHGDPQLAEQLLGPGKGFALEAGDPQAVQAARASRAATRFLARAQVPADQWPDDVRPPVQWSARAGERRGPESCAAPTRAVTATSGSAERALAPQYVPDGDYTYRLEATSPDGARVLAVYLLRTVPPAAPARYQLVATRGAQGAEMEGDDVLELSAWQDAAGTPVVAKRTAQRLYLIWTAGEPGELALAVRTLDGRDPARTAGRATQAQVAALAARSRLRAGGPPPGDDLAAALASPGSGATGPRVSVARLAERGAVEPGSVSTLPAR